MELMKKILLRGFFVVLAAFLFSAAFPKEATGSEFPINVPGGKQMSGGVVLTWRLAELPTRPNVVQKF